MSNFFDELEAQLHAAARAQITVNRPQPRVVRGWPRSVAHGIPILLAVGTSIAIAVFALVFVGHKHSNTPPPNPPSGGPPAASGPPPPLRLSHTQQAEVIYLEKAMGTAVRRDQACSPPPPGLDASRRPSFSQGSPGTDILAILGVLRRPSAPSDRLPARIIGAPPNQQVYPNGTIPPVKDVYARYIRRARWRFGAGYYLVPAGNVNLSQPLPERCYREQQAALHQELPQIPARLRAGALALEPRFLAYQHELARPYPGVCLLALNSTGNGDGCGGGYSISEIEQGHTISSGGPTGVGGVYGLVPDGIASVTLYYPAHSRHGPEQAITVKAINNVFIVHNPGQRLPNYGFPTKMIWRSGTGAVIKAITY